MFFDLKKISKTMIQNYIITSNNKNILIKKVSVNSKIV